jgi:hypothetical protein
VRRKNAAAPDSMRWCQDCNAYVPIDEFKVQPYTSRCHKHWLVWNRKRSRARHAKNPGYDAARTRRWRENNPDKLKALTKQQARRQKELGYPVMKRWQARHPEAIRAHWRRKDRAYRERYPERHAASAHRRRARRRAVPGHATAAELQALRTLYKDTCAYCNDKFTSWDHIVPVSDPRSTNYVWNILPACKICNSKKQDRSVEEFLKRPEINPGDYTLKRIARALQRTVARSA